MDKDYIISQLRDVQALLDVGDTNRADQIIDNIIADLGA